MSKYAETKCMEALMYVLGYIGVNIESYGIGAYAQDSIDKIIQELVKSRGGSHDLEDGGPFMENFKTLCDAWIIRTKQLLASEINIYGAVRMGSKGMNQVGPEIREGSNKVCEFYEGVSRDFKEKYPELTDFVEKIFDPVVVKIDSI